MIKKFYTGKHDRVFKTIFCNEENPKLLKEFLTRTLKREVEIIEFLRNELPVASTVDKVKTVDVLVKVDGEYIHIEINANNKDYIPTRNFIYFTNVYSRKVTRGNNYYDLKTKFLHIDLTYGLPTSNKEIARYYVMNEDKNKYINNFEIVEYNMDKFMKYWYNLDKEKIEEYKHLIMLDLNEEELSKLSKGDELVMEYEKEITDLNNQETFQSYMTYEEDQQMINNTEKHMAYEEGIKTEKVEIAKSMLSKNIDINTISECTGLSIEEINTLK